MKAKTTCAECAVCGTRQNIVSSSKVIRKSAVKYPAYCPDPETLLETELKGALWKCKKCGYVAQNLEENMDITKEMLEQKNYRYPFGDTYEGSEEAVLCYQAAMLNREKGYYKTCVKYFIYAAVLVKEDTLEKQCYKNAYEILEHIIERTYYDREELLLAYLNVLRMLGKYETVKNLGNRLRYQFRKYSTENVLDAIVKLAEKENSQYMTYLDMMFIE